MNTFPTDARRRRSTAALVPLLGCTLVVAMALPGGAAATTGAGVTPRAVAVGGLDAPVRAKLKAYEGSGFGDGTAVDDIVVIEYTVAPGGYFGWHQHGGPVWVVVNSGTLTLYGADDPTCSGTPHPAGSAFLDAGNHTHNARNEGTAPVVVVAIFMLPNGAPMRIDAPNPGVCPF